MNIPNRLTKLIARNSKLNGAINLTLHDFSVWFSDRNMVFFPEYTDHGPKHIEEVIVTAQSLIKDESWRHVTPEDAAVLILSIVLHDCAMHVSEDGFAELVTPKSSRPISPGFSERTWPDLWADFLSEASRFDARKLKSIFGNTDPIRRPPLDPLKMTGRDRLLIGEFLRRHHPRLAHEIALWGVPGPTSDKVQLLSVPNGLANLSGLIARSHGVNLRTVVESVPRIHRREHYNVHAPFLMAVVRIADYMQIHAERAPKQVLNVRALRSPISQGEWKAHEAIEEINSTHDDPEALVVIAAPREVRTFLRLERLLSGLQQELDESWAVLGEVYGRVPGLQDLGITIRRVRSNLEDRHEFSKTVSYYPDHIVFEADPEILKLLVEPLYGNNGGIAVRELVQNAVDACLERRDYVKTILSEVENRKLDADVTVHLEIEENSRWLTVSDRGIGMTAEVIKNYFLKAGASFRRSDAWKKQHESEEGESRVLRSGRFGIGVLAAFLIGDHVQVTTRHISEPPSRAVHFSASIDDDAIELQKLSVPEVGTTIRIRLDEVTADTFKRPSSHPWEDKWDWDWYRLRDPRVERIVSVEEIDFGIATTETFEQATIIPACKAKLPTGWHRVHHKDFDDVQWRFSAKPPHEREEDFFCNGIKVVGEYGGGVHLDKKRIMYLTHAASKC